jgi:hypothetical protein
MKIALCLSGQPRTFEECFSYLEENIIKNNPQFEFDLFGYFNSSTSLPYLNNYPFKTLVVEPDVECPNMTYQDNKYTINYPSRARPTFFQMWGMQQVNKLRQKYELKNNFEYDFIAKVRPDFKFLSEVDFSNLEKNKIYIPVENDHFGYNDRFAVGDGKIMNYYMDRVDFYLAQHPEIPNYTTHTESNLKIWLDLNKIEVNRILFSYCTCRINEDVEYVFI